MHCSVGLILHTSFIKCSIDEDLLRPSRDVALSSKHKKNKRVTQQIAKMGENQDNFSLWL